MPSLQVQILGPDLAVSHSHAVLFPIPVDDVQEDLTESPRIARWHEMAMGLYRNMNKNTCRHTVTHCHTFSATIDNAKYSIWWAFSGEFQVPRNLLHYVVLCCIKLHYDKIMVTLLKL